MPWLRRYGGRWGWVMAINHFLIACICAAFLLFLVLVAKNAACYWCTPTFCGFDHDCPQSCSCCIVEGDITGECC